MATVKKSTAKKAAPEKAAPKKDDVSRETPAEVAPVGLSEADVARIAAQAVAAAMAPVMEKIDALSDNRVPDAVRQSPGGKHIEGEDLETLPVMPEEAAGWDEEQIAEFNRREQAKMRARKRAQAENRKDLESLGTAERIRRMNAPRDPSITRRALPEDWDGDEEALVKVRSIRRVGLNQHGDLSDIDEEILMPPDNARHLQKSGVVEVVI